METNNLIQESLLNDFFLVLQLEDDKFKMVSEAMLFELEKEFKDSNSVAKMINELNEMGINEDNLEETIEDAQKMIIETFEKEEKKLSQEKIDFLARFYNLLFNAYVDKNNLVNGIKIPFSFTNKEAKIPKYAHDTDSGMDVYALEDVIIGPGETVLVDTGIAMALPMGYEIQVRPKSGRALKTKLRVANSPGTVDASYRDTIKVIIENIEPKIADIGYEFQEDGTIKIKSILHGNTYYINKGDKFAQLVLAKVEKANLYEVSSVKNIGEDRGGGFGSTGLK